MIEAGRIVRVDIMRRGVFTLAGAGVGETEARITSLYGDRVSVSSAKYTDGHYLTVTPSDSLTHPFRLIFETEDGVVTQFRGGTLPQVVYVEGCG